MAYRNKVFISFDGDNDMYYYRLMRAWKQNDYTDFNFYDAHDLTQARDTSAEDSIKRSLSQRLANAKVVVSLIGESTRYLYKFLRWELEQAIRLNLPIVGVNLNGHRSQDSNRCPPVIRDHLVVYVSFNAAIIQHALENWPSEYQKLRLQSEVGARYYDDDVYRHLGL